MLKYAAGLLAILIGIGLTRGQDVQTTVVPGASARLFAIAPETGMVAFGSAGKSVVTVCPKLASDGVIDQSVSQQLDAIPSQLMYKRLGANGYFFAFCQSNDTIYQLDAATLAIVSNLALKVPAFSIATATVPNDPWIYYGTGQSIGRVNWRTMVDSGELAIDTPGFQNNCQVIAVTPDGDEIYAKNDQPAGLRSVFQLHEDKHGQASLRRLSDSNAAIEMFVPDLISGTMAYDRDGIQRLEDPYEDDAKIEHSSICFMAGRPLIFALTNDEFVIYSHNTEQELARLTITPPQADMRGFRRQVPLMLADEKHGTVLICKDGSVSIVSLSAFNLPDETILGLKLGPSTVLPTAPNDTHIPLIKTDPNEKVTVVMGPQGLRVVGNELIWNGGELAFGEHAIELRISDGGVSKLQEFTESVTRPHADLSFAADDAIISEDGNYAVAFQHLTPMPYNRPNQGWNDESQTPMAVVDLSDMQVVASALIPRRVSSAAMDGSHVYVGAANANAFYAYSAKDLSEERRIFLDSPAQAIQSIAGRLFVREGQGIAIFDGRDLSPAMGIFQVETDLIRHNNRLEFASPMFTMPPMQLPMKTRHGWQFAGLEFDEKMDKVISASEPLGFQMIPVSGAGNGINREVYIGNEYGGSIEWGVRLEGNTLFSISGQTIGTLPIGTFTGEILSGVPAVACMDEDVNGGAIGADRKQRDAVSFYDLVSVGRQTTVTLAATEIPSNGFFPSRRGVIRSLDGKSIAVIGTRMYSLSTTQLDPSKFPVPPMLDVDQPLPVLEGDSPLKIRFTADGMSEPVSYSIEPPVDGVSIEQGTGKLTIDPKGIMAMAVGAMADQMQQSTMYAAPTSPAPTRPDADELIDSYVARVTPFYHQIFGKAPTRLPVAIRLNVKAQDKDQQIAQKTIAAILLVSRDQVASTLGTRLANASGFGGGPGITTAPDNIQTLKQQVAALQQRNADLEAQNKLLKEMILEKNQGTDGTPHQ